VRFDDRGNRRTAELKPVPTKTYGGSVGFMHLLGELTQPALITACANNRLDSFLGSKKPFNLKCRLILPGKPQVILRLLVKPALSRSVKSH
jgi:hypothetical protein